MLIPILLSKFPEDLNLEISRKYSKNVWDIKLIFNALRFEIEAREKIVSVGASNSYLGESFSSASLFVGKGSVKPPCIFCNKTNYSSIKCRNASKPCNAKKNFVFYFRKFYLFQM